MVCAPATVDAPVPPRSTGISPLVILLAGKAGMSDATRSAPAVTMPWLLYVILVLVAPVRFWALSALPDRAESTTLFCTGFSLLPDSEESTVTPMVILSFAVSGVTVTGPLYAISSVSVLESASTRVFPTFTLAKASWLTSAPAAMPASLFFSAVV